MRQPLLLRDGCVCGMGPGGCVHSGHAGGTFPAGALAGYWDGVLDGSGRRANKTPGAKGGTGGPYQEHRTIQTPLGGAVRGEALC